MSADEVSFGLTSPALRSLRYDRGAAYEKLDPIESDWLVCSMIPTGSRVLDVGCGTGVLMAMIRDARDAEVVGVEPNAERAQTAQARGLDISIGLVTPELLQRLGDFDVVLFADVLEHLEDPASLLAMVREALRPGGRIVASIPNVAHWRVRLDLLFGRFDPQPTGIMDATHLRWFTEKSVRTLFERAGLTIQGVKHSAGLWQPCYNTRVMRRIPFRLRRLIVRDLTRAFPKLFGCQHVVSASADARS